MLTLVPRSRWNCWACRRCDLGWDAGPVGAPLEAAAADGGFLPARLRAATPPQAAAAAQEAPFRSDPAPQEAPGHSDPSLVASESEHRRCCAAAWRHHWREGADLCSARRGEAAALSRLSCVDVASEASGSWYCSARQLLLNASAVHLGSPDVSVPTPAQKGLWGRRALLLDCRLDMEELRRPKRFRMLLGQLLPSALGEIDGVARGPIAEPAERTVVFVARYSVKNFYLGHYDLLQTVAILLHALGPDFYARAQIVLVPPDKANHGWWGPQRLLWASLASAPTLSYVEWLQSARPGSQHLVRVPHAVFALSGFHSVYGRGVVGKAFERVCAPRALASSCATSGVSATRLAPVSAWYRTFLSFSLARMGVLYLPSRPEAAPGRPAPRLPGLWISRGKGHGGAYGKQVARRCLNEPALLEALEASGLRLALRMAELADMPFGDQLAQIRAAAVLTGMHGAGFANMIFMAPGSVVAELCPLGYCTDSFRTLAPRLGLAYLRWTNAIASNAFANYDTVVEPHAFVELMRRALALADW